MIFAFNEIEFSGAGLTKLLQYLVKTQKQFILPLQE